MMVSMRTGIGVAAALVVAMSAACGDGAAGKAGVASHPITLNAIVGLPGDPAFAAFAAAVERTTAGRVRIRARNLPKGPYPNEELHAFQSVAAGRSDIGMLPTRALEAGGESAMAAFDAPLAVPSVAAERRVIDSEAPRLAIKGLTRVRGLAIVAGEILRPFGTVNAVLGPADYAGAARFVTTAPTYAATAAALGATPVVLGEIDARGQIIDRRLRWTIADLRGYQAGSLYPHGTLTTNVALFVKFWALFTAPHALDRLSASDRAAVINAAGAAEPAAIANLRDERLTLLATCRAGGRIAAAAPADVAAVAAAVAAVTAGVAGDPKAGPVFTALRAAVGGEAMAGALDPSSCISSAASSGGAPAGERSVIPSGTFRLRISLRDVREARPELPIDDQKCGTGEYTLQLASGRFAFSGQSIGEWKGTPCAGDSNGTPLRGSYTSEGNTVTFVLDQLIAETGMHETSRSRWSMTANGGLDLTFLDGEGNPDSVGGLALAGSWVNHWRKVG
jgi:TRAP-type C4-dicarboxylate transport system substrate-binding protein